MKAELKLYRDGYIELRIYSENATETIALKAWSNEYDFLREVSKASLLILTPEDIHQEITP
jgi:hypothetical protein